MHFVKEWRRKYPDLYVDVAINVGIPLVIISILLLVIAVGR